MDVVSLGFRTDLMVRRLGGSVVADRGDHLVVRTPHTPDFWWGNFLLLPGPLRAGDAARWAARFPAELPGATHRAYGIDGTDGAVGDPDEVAALGVRAQVSVVLTATRLREPPPPAASCRLLTGDDDWAQAVELRLACHGAADEAQVDAARGRLAEARAMQDAGCAGRFGAFVDGRLVSGLGIVGDRSGLARYQSVETHPDFRRRGLASALLYAAGRFATDRLAGETLVIVADPDDAAISLYRGLGFRDREWQAELESSG